MIKEDYEDFQKSTKSWICKKPFEKSDLKVKDHDHINEKYRRPVHQNRNFNLSLIKKIPVAFHNLQKL